MANNHNERLEPMLSLENMPELVEMPEPKWRATIIGLLHEGQHRMRELEECMGKFEDAQLGIRTEMEKTHKLAEGIAQDTADVRAFLTNSKQAFHLIELGVNGIRWTIKWVVAPFVMIMVLWRLLNGQGESAFLRSLIDFIKG